MATEIVVPRLGWSMDEGAFGGWLKAEGARVEAGEPLFALESDKALQEVEAIDSGILRLLPSGPQQGETVSVGAVLGFLVGEGEELPATATIPTVASASPAATNTTAPRQASRERFDQPLEGGALPAISPRAARLARQLGIDWTVLRGSGKTGRIREQDIRAASGGFSSATSAPALKAGGARRVIAQRMAHSARTTAPVTLMRRVDATNLVALRARLKATHSDEAPAIHDMIARLAAQALKSHPVLNCQWIDDQIVEPDGIHIGIAVDTDHGLLVPVIRDCDQLTLTELARRSRDLIARARKRQCAAEELRGGTFSITNLGAVGIEAFTPIIDVPQAAILGLGAIRREPALLDDGRIDARHVMTLSLTFDHRIVDGAPAARFLQTLAGSMEALPASC